MLKLVERNRELEEKIKTGFYHSKINLLKPLVIENSKPFFEFEAQKGAREQFKEIVCCRNFNYQPLSLLPKCKINVNTFLIAFFLFFLSTTELYLEL